MQRIGVFVCHCGTNIAATVDVKTVAETLSHEAQGKPRGSFRPHDHNSRRNG